MPIASLDRKPPRFKHLGRVRLGHKETSQSSGREFPKADPFFVLDDVPELAQVLKEEHPTSIPVEFLFDDPELTFPYYLRRYGKMGLLCLGDGQHVMYQKEVAGHGKDTTTRLTVKDGLALDQDGKVIWTGKNQERAQTVPCLDEECPHRKSGECKPTGYLRFLVTGAERQGYYDLVCHQRAIHIILAQMDMARGFFGRITSIPWLLQRGEPEDVEVPTKDGPKPFKIRTQYIEIEPRWWRQNIAHRREIALAEAQRQRYLHAVNIAVLSGEDAPLAPLGIPATIQEFGCNNWPGERAAAEPWSAAVFEHNVVEDEDAPEPEYIENGAPAPTAPAPTGPPPEAVALWEAFCQRVRAGIPALKSDTAGEQIKAALRNMGFGSFKPTKADALFSTLQAWATMREVLSPDAPLLDETPNGDGPAYLDDEDNGADE